MIIPRPITIVLTSVMVFSGISASSIAADHKFKIWVKTFIPRNVPGSRPIPEGNGTMISIPLVENIIGCFGTDNRNFSSSFDASARMTASVSGTDYIGDYDFYNECGLTKQYVCSTGRVSGSGRCDAKSAMIYSYNKISKSIEEYSFVGAAGNPLVFGSPDIDFEITVKEDWSVSGQVNFYLSGRVDDFPAFEAYVELDGQTKQLFAMPPKPGCGPECLYGKAKRPVRGQASFGL